MRHMQQNICSPAKDIKTFIFTDSTGTSTVRDCRMLVYHRIQVLLQTAITSVRISDFEKKSRFFEEALQRALFKTLVITIVFKT